MSAKQAVIANNMNNIITKKNLLIFLAMLAAAGLLSYYALRRPTDTPPKAAEKAVITAPKAGLSVTKSEDLFISRDDCAKISTSTERKLCLARASSSLAAAANNIKRCLEVDDFALRQQCVFELANQNTDSKACKRIADKKMRQSCLEVKSLSRLDSKFCDEIDPDEKYELQECRDRLAAFKAEKTADIDSCTNIKTLEYNNLCMQKAGRQGAVCSSIKDSKQRELCNSIVQYQSAKTNLDCEAIKTESYRKVCLAAMANINNKDYKFDDDNDGINNTQELWISTDPFKADTDGDGLTDYVEFNETKTNPLSADTDNDGLTDTDERKNGTDPKMANLGTPKPAQASKESADESENAWWLKYKPASDKDESWKKDSDGDSLIDIDEVFYLSNPFKADTDGDGMLDGKEIRLLADPNGPGFLDFDGDGLSDKQEAAYGTNPTLSDTNRDGLNDNEAIAKKIEAAKDDTDNDGLNNTFELKAGTNPFVADTDGDGHGDGEEVNTGFNPCGEGKIPSSTSLKDACSKYVK